MAFCSLSEFLPANATDKQQYLGKWYLQVAVGRSEADIQTFRAVDSFWITIEDTDNNTLLLTGHMHIGDNCFNQSFTFKINPDGNGLKMDVRPIRKNLFWKMSNCSECLIFQEIEPNLRSCTSPEDSLNRILMHGRQGDPDDNVVRTFLNNAAHNNMSTSIILPHNKDLLSSVSSQVVIMLNEAWSCFLSLFSFISQVIVPCSLPEQLPANTIDHQQYLGKWYFKAAISHNEAEIQQFKALDNMWFTMDKVANDTLLLTGHMRIMDCPSRSSHKYLLLQVWCGLLTVAMVVMAALLISVKPKSAEDEATTLTPRVRPTDDTIVSPLRLLGSSLSCIQLERFSDSWEDSGYSCQSRFLTLRNNAIHCAKDGLYFLYAQVTFRDDPENARKQVILIKYYGGSQHTLVEGTHMAEGSVWVAKFVKLKEGDFIRINITGNFLEDTTITFWGAFQLH
ncbi:uncharacterized protein V6R79_009649 [Siganus canaliculatus]